MNFFKYLGIDEDTFIQQYLNTGLVSSQKHPTLPLVVFCYGRKAVHEQLWDGVTSRCRGIVVDIETDEIIARPFEKFHNYGTTIADQGTIPVALMAQQPVVWEKMDGFMITAFFYCNEWYAASKCSFTSIHAKWATAELRRKMSKSDTVEFLVNKKLESLRTMTLMFEGLHPDLRIVIDYKRPAELVLLSIIHNETGDELTPDALRWTSEVYGFNIPDQHSKTVKELAAETMEITGQTSEEGYVLTWYRPGTTPFRLKMKYIDYLRLHRMVTGVSPKRIWEVLAGEQTTELNDYLNNSTPWFSDFVKKWMRFFQTEYQTLLDGASTLFAGMRQDCLLAAQAGTLWTRKDWALRIKETKPEFHSILFSLLDGKDIRPVIWKQLRHKAVGSPMVDSHTT